VDRCLLEAITLNDQTDQIEVDPDKCIGCGICTLTCSQETLKLYRYERSTAFETSQKLLETVARENREVEETPC
jgi:Fe-S-cluster-containing hydrogenase component 2